VRNKVIFHLILVFVSLSNCIHIESTDESNQKAPVLPILNAPTADTVKVEYETVSLLGKKLLPVTLTGKTKRSRERSLKKALDNYTENPDSLEYIIWYGRRLSYAYQYKRAIEVYTKGLEKHSDSYKLYRHRGHRYLTLRKFNKAIEDLEKAVFFSRNAPIEMEKDGLPNRRNIPRNSVQFNIWYHLGLAYYLTGNYDKSVSAYKKCLMIANNDDMLVSASDWLYMTYRKTGNSVAAEALLEPIKRRMNIVENYSYHRRLLMYKGMNQPSQLFNIDNINTVSIDQLTLGYGVGNWYYYNGKTEKAVTIFNKLLESPYWPSFGYMAAEVELANIKRLKR
jgi:tetratricopeptide (TPR) repeat protein